MEELFLTILPVLDKKLQKYEFLVSDDLSVADLVLYNELHTVLILHKRQLESREMSNVFAWYYKVGNIHEVKEANRLFVDIVHKYNFI